MAEDKEKEGPAEVPKHRFGDFSEYPPREFPVIYTDGISSMAHGHGHVKMYLMRTDPSMYASGSSNTQPFAQVVMPFWAFISAAVFMRQHLQAMLKAGAITQAEIDAVEASWAERV
jgi:hypothetical protein